jgi:hypothetical protein
MEISWKTRSCAAGPLKRATQGERAVIRDASGGVKTLTAKKCPRAVREEDARIGW